jgi:hydroxyethylthiazole kinase-like uncharacterized protein yjeF
MTTKSKATYQDKLLFPNILWKRPVNVYAPGAGKILIIAGSKNMTGEAMLTCEAVFRSGTGVLVLGYPESLSTLYKGVLDGAMTLELPETPSHTLAKKSQNLIEDNARSCDVVIIGPGLSHNAETTQLIWELIFSIQKPVVLDSDGISALIKGIEVLLSKENETYLQQYFKARQNELTLVVNLGEAARLAAALRLDKKFTTRHIEENPELVSSLISDILCCKVVLRGNSTILVNDTEEAVINRLGALGLATKGSSDVLSGIIGSFIGQNPEKHTEAVATAIFLYDMAAKVATEKVGNREILPSDIIRFLPEAIKIAENE